MSMIKSEVKRPVDGYLKVERTNIHTGEKTLVWEEKNLVLNMGSTILRNLLFGDVGEIISKITFGDMNLDPNVDDVVNVDPPQLTDTALINKLYEKALTKTKVTYGGHPAIKYEATLAANEFNGTGQQLITEFALATPTEALFSRKTKSAIFKDAESALTFTWYLVFN